MLVRSYAVAVASNPRKDDEHWPGKVGTEVHGRVVTRTLWSAGT